jgi:PAS domain-containing protein
MDAQRPLELILARNLLASLSTPSVLTDDRGTVVFYNEAAGRVLGRPFEESGPMTAEEWGEVHGPLDARGERIPYADLKMPQRMLSGRAGHDRFHIRTLDGQARLIEVSGLPIVSTGGQRGGMTFFWEAD